MPGYAAKCPFCLVPFTDPPRHIDTHADTRKLNLYVFNRVYSLKEVSDGYQCPLCSFIGLPFPLYAHLQSHFTVHDEASTSPDTDEEPPRKKIKATTIQPVSSISRSTPLVNPFAKRHLPSLVTTTASQRTLIDQEPTTPTPVPNMQTPPTSLHQHHHQARQAPTIRTSVDAELNELRRVVVRFLEGHKETCLLHTMLQQVPETPHASLFSCDFQSRPRPEEYNNFRSEFRKGNNSGRCSSCGCPKLDGVPHNGSWSGPAKSCQDECLQDWIIGLCYYVWTFADLREKVFALLGVPIDGFGRGDEARAAYALWLGQRSGRHTSYITSNLLDLLYVIAQNAESLFGRFDSNDTALFTTD
ncbi:hypothetical protein J3R83DRAFT_4374 [Lanmaoa asiatica]|nr:hypothetical protein J3R83DRAFT_4374 [Lanmaoa asiatica]